MAAIFEIKADVPKETLRAFSEACKRYQTELGNSQAVAVRRGTIHLIKSLRKNTIQSKRQAPLKDVTKYEPKAHENDPKYITPKGEGQESLRRWAIRRKGGKDERFYVQAAETRAEARRKFAQYNRWGLAKKSWGWLMKFMFRKAEPSGGNPKVKPIKNAVYGRYREVITGSNPRVSVVIVNKLNYICEALPDKALEESMKSATNSINEQFDKGHAKARKELT